MPTTFIALQCFQCSTMQVKQQKKSNNKWTCVVCNQKQSVRTAFAQSSMARDLRKFVQSFNMSRKFAEDSLKPETLIPTSPDNQDQQRKRRADWSEYLDQEEERHTNLKEEDQGDDFGEPQIVTTEEMFKKPKLRSNNCTTCGGSANNLYKSVLSSRKTTKNVQPQGDQEARRAVPTMGIPKASKWNDYMTHEDNDSNLASGRNFADDVNTCRQSLDDWETILEDQKVEDDIHPDFV